MGVWFGWQGMKQHKRNLIFIFFIKETFSSKMKLPCSPAFAGLSFVPSSTLRIICLSNATSGVPMEAPERYIR